MIGHMQRKWQPIKPLFEKTIPEARWGHAVPIKRKRAWKPKAN
jgi:hypothetical protein